jgi:hypothetical protein
MMKRAGIFFLLAGSLCADSINLFNDSEYTLKAVIYDANATMLGEFILNSRDATEWSNDQNYGAEMAYASASPYTVNWTCLSGGPYGSCDNVAAGSTVTAQSCGGVQECTTPQSTAKE